MLDEVEEALHLKSGHLITRHNEIMSGVWSGVIGPLHIVSGKITKLKANI